MTSDNQKSKLLFVDASVSWNNTILNRMELLFSKFLDDIQEGERVLIKAHFGQLGNTAAMRPSFIRTIVEFLKNKGALPTAAETTGLGYGFGGGYAGRGTGSDYLNMAERNGFSMSTIGAPIIMLDGEIGTDTVRVNVDGKYIDRVEVARGFYHFDRIIMFTHAKGHSFGGIGGAIKNIGIGCVGKYSKGRAHFGENPIEIDPEKCKGAECAKCLTKCPVRCISIVDNVATIDHEACIKCVACASVCRNLYGLEDRAISVQWNASPTELPERFAENAKGVVDGLQDIRIDYINLILDVSPVCDCMDYTPYLMTGDIGILAGHDPVAIDQASVDFINQAPVNSASPLAELKPGDDKFALAHARKDKEGQLTLSTNHNIQLQRAEEMGLGSREYEIEEIGDEKS
ncbi:MAG: DUF362 domain-containing protein [Candidatus Hodarchaeales archaeon]|jgi:uncharacterized Fe-S center protein